MELGKLEKIQDLRTVWKHEEYDFSTWLCEEENLNLLGETIGLDISLIEREAKAGNFEIDIFAEETNTGKKIIIENQLEDTNHDHLGKIITYASVKSADFIIWIVKKARDEHRQAIEWLNNHTDESVNIFLLEIELWKIEDSKIAPKFNIVVQPNEWFKINKNSSLKLCQLKYWEEFKKYALDNNLNTQKAKEQNWINVSIGTSKLYLQCTVDSQKKLISTAIYIPNGNDIFQEFYKHKSQIESIFNSQLIWKGEKKDCRIVVSSNGDINNESDWENQFKFFCDSLEKFKKIIHNYI